MVFWLTSSKSSFKQPKKPWVFLVFSRSRPKQTKKTRGKPKNKNEPQTKHSLKSFGFLVFWFSRGFLVFGFLEVWPAGGAEFAKPKRPVRIWYWCCNYVFPFLSPYIGKNTFHYRPLVSTISLWKRLSQKYVRQFIWNFFLWRPDFFKAK